MKQIVIYLLLCVMFIMTDAESPEVTSSATVDSSDKKCFDSPNDVDTGPGAWLGRIKNRLFATTKDSKNAQSDDQSNELVADEGETNHDTNELYKDDADQNDLISQTIYTATVGHNPITKIIYDKVSSEMRLFKINMAKKLTDSFIDVINAKFQRYMYVALCLYIVMAVLMLANIYLMCRRK